MTAGGAPPLGVVLAGGAGRRAGGDKALLELAGRPLAAHAVAALRTALSEVIVAAKPATALPPLPGIAVVREPAEPRHPLAGVLAGLRAAAGRPVVVCAVDLPLVPPLLVARLARGADGDAAAVVPRGAGRLQPLIARYASAATAALTVALERRARVLDVVAGLDPVVIEWPDPEAFTNVNRRADLAAAEAALARR